MSATNDRSAALRNRNAGQDVATVSVPRAPSGRPADLVITSELIPVPALTGASGPLSEVEQHELGLCERAVENMAAAAWLAGKALQTIRDAKLYRHTHARFEDYIAERWEIGERTAYQLIEEWALAERLNQVLGKPATASHTRALLPVASRFGLDTATDLYQQLRLRTHAEGIRLTATITSQIVKAGLRAAGKQAEQTAFQDAARQLLAAPALTLNSGTNASTTPIPSAPRSGSPQPVDGDSGLRNFAGSHDEVTAADSAGVLLPDATPPASTQGAAEEYVGPQPQETLTGTPVPGGATAPVPPFVVASSAAVPTPVSAGSASISAMAVSAPDFASAQSAPDALFVLEDIRRRVATIQRDLSTTLVRSPANAQEQGRLDALVDEIVQRLRSAANSLIEPDPQS
ncbi:hypothetical protein ABIA33_007599 [Streptacidiphilus sp. MAP12-16]|uniref:hypothetical protein n=1 Tax=Streptacidiphilus sp. MAP12-16 TaxID=3156300 RepID=UPI0035137B34